MAKFKNYAEVLKAARKKDSNIVEDENAAANFKAELLVDVARLGAKIVEAENEMRSAASNKDKYIYSKSFSLESYDEAGVKVKVMEMKIKSFKELRTEREMMLKEMFPG